MTRLVVNGRSMEFEAELSGFELLSRLDRNGHTLVIELNGSIVSLEQFRDTILRDGDELELVTLVGGG